MASERRSGGNLESRGENQGDPITTQPIGRNGKNSKGGRSATTIEKNPEGLDGDWAMVETTDAATFPDKVYTYIFNLIPQCRGGRMYTVHGGLQCGQ